jgi:hypothetical protein
MENWIILISEVKSRQMLELYELYRFASYDSIAILCAVYDSIVVKVINNRKIAVVERSC